MSGMMYALLALAHALRAGLVTPVEAADRLLILAHRVRASVVQVEASSRRDESPAPSTAGKGA
jgi:hypothetical protein